VQLGIPRIWVRGGHERIAEVRIWETTACRSEVGYQISGNLVVVEGNEAALMKAYYPIVGDGGKVGIVEFEQRLKGMGRCKKKTKMAATGSILYYGHCNNWESIPLETC